MVTGYKYFLYSEEQIKEKNQALSKTGKVYEPGTVVVNGARKKFTQLSNTNNMPRYIDTKIVAEGEVSGIVYTMPKTSRKVN